MTGTRSDRVAPAAGGKIDRTPPIVRDAFRSTGEPIEASTRSDMEARFHRSFGDIRIHNDSSAATAAKAVGAKAFTVGQDIGFAAGAYTPKTGSGRHLLAHELAHTVQQRGARTDVAPGVEHEREADTAADRATTGSGKVAIERPSGVALARKEDSGSADTGSAPAAAGRRSRVSALVELLRRMVEKGTRQSDKDQQRYLKTMASFMDEFVTTAKMAVSFKALPPEEKRTAEWNSWQAHKRVKALEWASRTGDASLADDRTWTSALDAVQKAEPYLEYLVTPPVPLQAGWHRVMTEGGETIGYLKVSNGYYETRDADLKLIESGETPLERPLIDPIDLVAGGLAGPIRGALRGAITTLVRRAAPRLAAAMLALDAGITNAGAGSAVRRGIAEKVYVAAEVVTTDAIEASRGAPASAARAPTSTTATTKPASGAPASAAKPATTPQAATGGTAAVSSAGATTATHAETNTVSQSEYEARLAFPFPGQYDNPVFHAVVSAGQEAAAVLTNPNTAEGARFIAMCRNRQWALAGTTFHAEAAKQLRRLARSIQLTPEDTVQSGAGGSRLDVTAIDKDGKHYSVDWKTTGRSAFTSSARKQMAKHAEQYEDPANRGTTLDVQISMSWVDLVRGRITNVTWPK